MQRQITNALVRALAYRATSRVPWWLVVLILGVLYLMGSK